MSNVHSLLPTLTTNRQFMEILCDSERPSFAMGFVEERKRVCGFLALCVKEAIPVEVTNLGFSFGHGLLGTPEFQVILFSFRFYGFETYHVLVNPNNALVRSVIPRMIESGDYFVFALKPNHSSTVFRADLGDDNLSQLRSRWDRIERSTTGEAEYQRAVQSFRRRPDPPGQVLEWVCRDTLDYLDLSHNRLDMRLQSLG